MTNGLPKENRGVSGEKTVFSSPFGENHAALGVGFILIGALMLYDRIYHSLYRMDMIPQWVYRLLQDVPGVAVALGIIVLGVWLVRGKRPSTEEHSRYREGDREEGNHDKRSAQ